MFWPNKKSDFYFSHLIAGELGDLREMGGVMTCFPEGSFTFETF